MDTPRIILKGKELKIIGTKDEKTKQSTDFVPGINIRETDSPDHRILEFPGTRERKVKEIFPESKEEMKMLGRFCAYLISTGGEISFPISDVEPMFIKRNYRTITRG